MPEGNPLVAQAQSQTTGVTGIGIAESAVDLANGVSDGSWVEAGLGAVGVGLEVLSMVVDPIGTLASYGVSWLIEHVQPLKEALDWLAGDPPVIQSFSETWANVAAEVNAIAGDLGNEVTNGTAGWQGEGADAYRGAAAEQADALAGAASLADGISAGVMIMGTVVAAVRELVRDLVAELVGKLITWALEAAATLGFATPAIAVQATTAITKTISKISDFIRKLVKTIGNVSPKIRKIIDKLGEIIEKLSKMLRKGGKPGSSTTPSGAKPSTTKTPDTTPNSPDTTPSGTDTTPDGGSPTTPDGGKPGNGNQPDSPSNRPDNPQDTKTPPERRYCKDDPVDVVSGEVILSQVDLALPAALPLVIRRVHVSSYRAGRALGPNWASTVDQRLEFDSAGIVYVSDDGTLLTYPDPVADHAPVLPAVGPRWPLTRTGDGYLISKPDANQFLHFAGGGRLDAVEDRNRNRIDLDYTPGGTLTQLRHSGGYRVLVEQSGGRIARLVLAGESGESNADIEVVRYEYDDRGRLAKVFNSSTKALQFSYDSDGRLVRWDDRTGSWYGYRYDARGRCVANEGAGGFLNGTFDYDADAMTTVFTDALGNRTTYRYDEARNVVELTDPLGNVTHQEWNDRDQLVTRRDPLGRVTRFDYDEHGNLVTATRPDGSQGLAEYNEFGLPTTQVDPGGAVWRYDYDERGNIMAATEPSGAVTRYLRDERGNLVGKTDPLGATTRLEVSAAGLPVAVTDALGATTRYTRDQFGRLSTVVDPLGNRSSISWTVEGKLLARTYADGTVERWRYDGEGARVEHIDALGQSTHTETTHFDLVSAITGPTGARTEFEYDTNLRITAVRNAAGLVWRYHYDAAGNRVGETDYNGRELRYTYDPAGQLVSVVNGAGETTSFVYDQLGRIAARHSGSDVSTFEFDEAGSLVRAVNADAEVTMRRDASGRVLAETVNGRTMSYRYDAAGRMVHRRTPAGQESTWEFDQLGRASRLVSGGRTLSFGYDVAGREVERLLDTGLIMASEWDNRHRLAGQTVSTVTGHAPQATVVQQRHYTYRADDAVLAIQDALGGTRNFGVDPIGRITAVDAPGRQERYAYDLAGNLVREPSAPEVPVARVTGTVMHESGDVRYQYDRQGRVVLKQKKRLSRKPDNWHYHWDAEDRLVGVVTPDGTHWRYRYDAFGRRIAKQRLGPDGAVAGQVLFTWDGSTLAEQIGPHGEAVTWDFDGRNRPVTQIEHAPQAEIDRRFYAIVTDLVGTPTELVDDAGQLAWRAQTTLWGEALAALNQRTTTPLRFPGQYHDDETGLHYNFFRYYDPETGRYQSNDPLGLFGTPNPHAYVADPMRLTDPLGLMTCEEAEDALRNLDPNDPANEARRSEAWNKLYEDAENHPDRIAERLQAERERLVRQAGNEIHRGQNVPPQLEGGRVDAPQAHVPGSQYHVQGRGNGSPGLNMDGSFHDGDPGWNRRTYEWAYDHGFAWPTGGQWAGQSPGTHPW
ncbi:RHS repeat-associated core domain-containing protein [Amycolatopsis sp. YIM 10]|uniref:RHS repeat-associated core domain-containing protein n=1 Tax=Amycolatopsis sp. YIM 10 TaxID=2653857 RepID=UPI0012906484|nr:RHS repeat-associated core domain-containing protein [Amycolatopsis sp. YIM 10]QFU88587.1 Putative deoxyribonuclease RhsC [Amycolatopsis sp. YIM 10]